MINIYRIILLVFLCMSSTYAHADIIGTVKKVVDGDTIHLTDDNGKLHKIRLLGIDAPEKDQICKKVYLSFLIFNFQKDYKCGEQSTLALLEKLRDKEVKCIIKKNKDRYKRNIGTCYIKNQDINSWLVRNGYAVAYRRYSKDYILDEKYAKKNKLGLWGGSFINPEKWRKLN